ncbi:chemotaxis protein CheX [Clostridium tagluense]|uniref:chemotaxis protein CheX n=1 Tax=Clostridium tagluense TaxID=360422 RepID=UPI001CF34003|nr:chemotaxis protein CheX [Clostridium tagluense]MCB2297381.1 chemotaxis protein CheX [Clostridium tagluense]
MNVEYINPFIEASKSIINQTTGFNPSLGKIYIKGTPYKGADVVVLIGLTGEIQGNVIISLSKKIACKIAAAMMGEISLVELDEIGKSAISELCNMILGTAASIFYKKNISIDITPPTVFTGNNIELSLSKAVIVCIPLEFDDGDSVDINITYKEK